MKSEPICFFSSHRQAFRTLTWRQENRRSFISILLDGIRYNSLSEMVGFEVRNKKSNPATTGYKTLKCNKWQTQRQKQLPMGRESASQCHRFSILGVPFSWCTLKPFKKSHPSTLWFSAIPELHFCQMFRAKEHNMEIWDPIGKLVLKCHHHGDGFGPDLWAWRTGE